MTKRKPGEPGKGWSKGTHIPDSRKRAISIANSGERNGIWKGDNVGNDGLHAWLKRHLPKPKLCELCNDRPPYDLANITGIYSREFKNWEYLCRKCHMYSDGRKQIKLYPWLCISCGKLGRGNKKRYDSTLGPVHLICWQQAKQRSFEEVTAQ